MSLANYYDAVSERSSSAMKKAVGAHAKQLGAIHQKIADLVELVSEVKARPEFVVYDSVTYDAALSLYFAVTGAYRASYSSQRAVLENGIAAVYYSAHPIRVGEWVSGVQNVSWKMVALAEEGALTEQFFNAFAPGLASERAEIVERASGLYSRLSDFVHKNIKTRSIDALQFTYDSDQFQSCLGTAAEVIDIVALVFSMRYLGEWSKDALESKAAHIDALVGSYPTFQKMIGGPAEVR